MADNVLVGKDLFNKGTDLTRFLGLKVTLSTGQKGVIESGFGQGGKFKVRFPRDVDLTVLLAEEKEKKDDTGAAATGGKKARKKGGKNQVKNGIKIILTFKRYTYALDKRTIVQS